MSQETKPICQTFGHISLFIPSDIFQENSQIVMDILNNNNSVKGIFTYNAISFGEFRLIPIDDIKVGIGIKNALIRLTNKLHIAHIPHRISVAVAPPFRPDIMELLLEYFVWLDEDAELQSFYYNRTIVDINHIYKHGAMYYSNQFSGNLETLARITYSFNRSCGITTGSESKQLERLQIFKAKELLNN